MLGSNLYLVDFEKSEIKVGKLIGTYIATTGYIMYTLEVNEQVSQLPQAYCFESEEEATAYLEANKDKFAKKKQIADDANKQIDDIVRELLGEPVVVQ